MPDLFGRYYVKPTASAIRDALDLFPKFRHYQEARRHALKLAFWPGFDDGGGLVEDLHWSWIDGMENPRAGELRIHETIGRHDNLRVIFHVSKIVLPKEHHAPHLDIGGHAEEDSTIRQPLFADLPRQIGDSAQEKLPSRRTGPWGSKR